MPKQTEPVVAPRLLDLHQAAQYIGMSEWYVREQVYGRKIAFVRLGKKYLFKPTDLDRFIEARRVEPRQGKAA